MELDELRRREAARVEADRSDLADLAVELGRMPSPHAGELNVATRVVDWLRQHEIEAWLQPITDRSANAVGRIRGVGDGPRLIFDAHIDTGPALPADVPERIRRIALEYHARENKRDRATELAAFLVAHGFEVVEFTDFVGHDAGFLKVRRVPPLRVE